MHKNKEKRNSKSYNVFATYIYSKEHLLHYSEEIYNSLKENNLVETISEYALEYIMSIMLESFSQTIDIERHSERHRTSISRFLRSEVWDDII